jgi:hypothetical protein
LKNIANSFTPQPETAALYPFLSSSPDLSAPAGQVGLSGLIDSVYANLFAHAADADGKAYWTAQITDGSIALGAAVLTIANGALGSDKIMLQNKLTVAQDFTGQTAQAQIGLSTGFSGLPASFLAAAKNVLSGVDGTALNDDSVTAAKAATARYVASASVPALAATQAAIAAFLSGGSEQVAPTVVDWGATTSLSEPLYGSSLMLATGTLALAGGFWDNSR